MADDNHADEPKKTETVEIRLAPELKEALRQTAEAEGRSISVVLRGLIDGYLAQARRPRSTLKEIVMFFRHPVRLAAVALGGLAIAVAGMTSSNAQDLTLTIMVDVFTGAAALDSDAGDAARSLRTEVAASYGRATSVTIGAVGAKTLVVDITPEPADDKSYNVWVALREVDGESSEVLATPVLQANFGEGTRVALGDDQTAYELEILGEKIAL